MVVVGRAAKYTDGGGVAGGEDEVRTVALAAYCEGGGAGEAVRRTTDTGSGGRANVIEARAGRVAAVVQEVSGVVAGEAIVRADSSASQAISKASVTCLLPCRLEIPHIASALMGCL